MKRIFLRLGIIGFAVAGFLTAFMAFFGVIMTSDRAVEEFNRGISQEGASMFRVLNVVYGLLGVMDGIIALGLIAGSNLARIATIILSPVPFVGAILFVLTLSPAAFLLMFVGISFPFAGMLFFNIFGMYTFAIFGTLNLLMFFHFRSKSVKNLFKNENATVMN